MNDGTRFYLLMLSNQMTACFTKTGLINCSTYQIFPGRHADSTKARIFFGMGPVEKKNRAPQGTYGLYSCKKGKLIIDLLNLFVVDFDVKNFVGFGFSF